MMNSEHETIGKLTSPATRSSDLSASTQAPDCFPVVVNSFTITDSSISSPQTEVSKSTLKASSPKTNTRKRSLVIIYDYAQNSSKNDSQSTVKASPGLAQPKTNKNKSKIGLAKYHDDPQKPSKKEKPKKRIKCDKCSYTAYGNWDLQRHSKSHDITTTSSRGTVKVKCPYTDCSWQASRVEYLDGHLHLVHGIQMEVDCFNFKDEDAANQWMYSMQEATYAKYRNRKRRIRQSANSKMPSKVQYFHCSRSGQFKQAYQGKGLRKTTKRNSIVGDVLCPSRILITTSETGVEVKHYKTHFGHTLEPWRVSPAWQIRRNMRNRRRNKQTVDGDGPGETESPLFFEDFSVEVEESDLEADRTLADEYYNKLLKLAENSQSTMKVLVDLLKADLATLEQRNSQSQMSK